VLLVDQSHRKAARSVCDLVALARSENLPDFWHKEPSSTLGPYLPPYVSYLSCDRETRWGALLEAYDRWVASIQPDPRELLGAVPVRPDAHVVDLNTCKQSPAVRGRGLTTTARDRCLVRWFFCYAGL
jgi:hypothetical protein